jgi:pimeloyl-ACP methyl ester carboxylesterase
MKLNASVCLVFALVFAMTQIGFIALGEATANDGFYQSHQPGKKRVVVFVHGFTGDAKTSWTAPNGAYFPKLLADDTRVKLADVYVVSYETHWRNEAHTVESLSEMVFGELDKSGVLSEHDQLIFLCHSLGGIVIERMLLSHPEVAAKTAFIQFYGTPHQGALTEKYNPLNAFLKVFADSPFVDIFRAGSDNGLLVKLDVDWKKANYGHIHRYCAVEDTPTRIESVDGYVMIVPYFSGSYGCDSDVPVDTVHGTHRTMVRPTDTSNSVGNEAYLIFLRNYRANPWHEYQIIDSPEREKKQSFNVDCERTQEDAHYIVTFDLDRNANEELTAATSARLDDRTNLKEVKPDPPSLQVISQNSVQVKYGFTGLDKHLFNCSGGGHATVVVHPVIKSQRTIADGQ